MSTEETKKSAPLRISRGHYGDLEAAALNCQHINPELLERWEQMKKDPGFEIVEHPKPDEFLVDLSVMFMYPNSIPLILFGSDNKPSDFSLEVNKGLKEWTAQRSLKDHPLDPIFHALLSETKDEFSLDTNIHTITKGSIGQEEVKDTRCKACQERVKDWQGSDPVCAFITGVFDSSNYRCATIARVRELMNHLDTLPEIGAWYLDNDERFMTIPIHTVKELWVEGEGSPNCLYVGWYKERGRTNQIWIMDSDKPPRAPTEVEVLAILTHYEAKYKHINPLK